VLPYHPQEGMCAAKSRPYAGKSLGDGCLRRVFSLFRAKITAFAPHKDSIRHPRRAAQPMIELGCTDRLDRIATRTSGAATRMVIRGAREPHR
jgi:hypothetical protein